MLNDIDTSQMSPYRKAEVEMAQAACEVLSWYYDSPDNEVLGRLVHQRLEERIDAWSEVQPNG